MHKSRLAAFVLDSQVSDIEQANKFWEQALGMPCVRSDEDWKDKYSSLETPVSQPNLLIHKVEHQSHIQLDIETDNIEAEVNRLLKLGASVHKKMERWVAVEALTGHRFCVVQPQRSDFESAIDVNEWKD